MLASYPPAYVELDRYAGSDICLHLQLIVPRRGTPATRVDLLNSVRLNTKPQFLRSIDGRWVAT